MKFSKLENNWSTLALDSKRTLTQEVALHFNQCKLVHYYTDEVQIEGATSSNDSYVQEEIFAVVPEKLVRKEEQAKEYCLQEWETINQKND